MPPPLLTSTDVAVVGAGPIGLELAVALAQAGVPSVQIEAGAIGSTIGWWAPGTRFFSSPERIEIAGVPLVTANQEKATREEYLAYLRGVVRLFDLQIRTQERVTRIERDAGGFRLVTRPSGHGVGGPEEQAAAARAARPVGADAPDEGVREVRARRVVLAIGDMHRPRLLGVPGEDLPHVSHYFDDPHLFFRSRVLIVGGKNSAVEAAIRCHRAGSEVAISYRGERFDAKRVKYWLRPEIEWLTGKGHIGWHPRTVPGRIERGRVVLASVDDPARTDDVAADFVLLLTGYVQDPTLFDQLGLELRGPERAPVVDLETMEASVPGVHVAGTAVGGSQQRTRIFLENSHVHVERIVRAIAGKSPAWPTAREYAIEEA